MNKILLTLLCSITFVHANIDFYNQTYINHARLGSSGVTVNFNVMAGSTTSSYNSAHKKTNLLNMLGTHRLDFIGIQQNGDTLGTLADPVNPNAPTATWQTLDTLTTDTITAINAGTDLGTYGQLEICGKLSFKSGAVTVVTPSYKGFHVEARLPFSSLDFSNLLITDLSPATGNGGFNLQRAAYTNVSASLDNILNKYGLASVKSRTKYTEKDIGDLELDIHYTHEINKTFQAAAQAGLILPTGKKKNENEVLSFAHGYDGHFGFKLGGALDAQLHEYVTIQSSVDALLFARNTKAIRLKTYDQQNGFVFLAKDSARRSKGAIVNFATRALVSCFNEHVFLSAGYLYTHSGKTTVTLTEDSLFSATVANTDKRFDSWYRHSVQGSITCALNNPKENRFNPQIAFIFSIPLAGKNIFNTKGYGADGAVTIVCEF